MDVRQNWIIGNCERDSVTCISGCSSGWFILLRLHFEVSVLLW